MKKIFRLALAAILFAVGTVSARLPEPASMPQDIKGTSPHKPEAAVYYLAELVKEGRMTAEEAERTEVYMIFRNARRMQDLQDVEGLSEEDRRAYMKRNVNCGEIPLWNTPTDADSLWNGPKNSWILCMTLTKALHTTGKPVIMDKI